MVDPPSSPPQRVSRYRSQRRAQQASTADDDVPSLPQSPPQQPASPVNDGIERSKSRYRRPGTAGGAARPATAKDQDQIDVPLRPRTSTRLPASGRVDSTQRPVTHGSVSRQRSNRYHERHASPPALSGAQDARRVKSDDLDEDAEEQRRRRLKNRYAQKEDVPSPASPVDHTPKQPSVTDLFPPPKPEAVQAPPKKVQFDGPPTSDGIRATKSMTSLPQYDDAERGGCFGFFKRKRPDLDPNAEKVPIARPVGDGEHAIKAGGGGIVPGIDAPVSAVNAGDRTVLVECGFSKSIFPVTPTTTPVDIIKSAAACMDEKISVKSAVLLEHFGTVGVQRPLRRYEHIRDVMNSWDTDRQNSLLLIDPGTGSSETELSLAGVPSHKPSDQSWLMQISQKPGKWDKRMIHLKSDGQMTLQKDPKKPQDQLTICHLSDFDIYEPTQEKIKKKIKPPKKICYAIKSQQKTSMFQSMENFVHFFCTNDRKTANDFYNAIQGWRSWYLVHVMGEGKKVKPPERTSTEKDAGSRSKTHKTGPSQDSHYHLGSFKPLMDVDEVGRRPASSDGPARTSAGFTKSSSQFDTTIASPERRTSTAKRRHHPPGAMSNRGQLAEDEPLANLGRRNSVDKRRPSLEQKRTDSDEFASSGLLGRSYSQRKREYDERETGKSSPFTEGANLLSTGHDDPTLNRRNSLEGGPRRGYSTRRPENHAITDLKRHSSNRRPADDAPKRPSLDLHRTGSRSRDAKHKPLVDLTPAYREPPQHAKKGKGFNPETIGPGGLIGSATSPDDPIGAPAATDWRGRNQPLTSPSGDREPARSASPSRLNGRSVHRSGTTTTRNPHEAVPTAQAFTGEGLLAGSQGQSGWGGGDKGRGVMDGSRAARQGKPMMELREEGVFQQGSLLGQAEREKGRGVVVDREWEEGY